MSFDQFKSLDPTMLAKITSSAEKDKEKRDAQSGGRNFDDQIPTAYLPEGKHRMRILADPDLNMYRACRFFTLHDPFARITDPRFFKQEDGTYKCGDTVIPEDRIETIWDLCKDLDYTHLSRNQILFYGLLIETNAKSEYWEPGTLYVVQANFKFEAAWMAQMTSCNANEEIAPSIAKSLNPTDKGWAWDLTVVSGAQGSVSITPTFMKDYPGPELDPETYLPLSQQVVVDGYTEEGFKRIETHLLAAREADGLNEEAPPEGSEDKPKDEDSKGDEPKGEELSEAEVIAKQIEEAKAKIAAEEAEKSRAKMAEDMKAASEKSESKEESKEEEKEVDPDLAKGAALGLSAAQVTAAKAANMDLEVFAKMVNPK